MKIVEHWPAILLIAILVAGVGIVVSRFISPSTGSAVVAVKIPQLSKAALAGKQAYDKNCAQCHGANGAGSAKGPPLVHDIYNPGHHGDASFLFAVKRGVRSHHWRFGNMPPQPRVNDGEIAAIIRYLRELQRANGIFYRPHRM